MMWWVFGCVYKVIVIGSCKLYGKVFNLVIYGFIVSFEVYVYC